MRSLLFVPGDDERKIVKAFETDADVIILDLEDSVAPGRKNAASAITRDALEAMTADMRASGPQVYVRINPLGDGQAFRDVDMVIPGRPNGIVLPKCESGTDASQASEMLVRAESELGVTTGTVKMMAIMTETAASLFNAGSYSKVATRLIALSWGAEDLSADIGATQTRDDNGRFLAPYEFARTLCLTGAAAAKLDAIDTVYVDFKDSAGLKRECEEALRDGFSGKLAIHPAQIPIINEAFTPLKSVVAKAQAIVEGFEKSAGTGVIAIDGEMVDRPHLVRAHKIIARAEQFGERDDPKPKARRKPAARKSPARKKSTTSKKSSTKRKSAPRRKAAS
ncbi:MAG: HpcH/HpaI aldolase/citrate lyase family protein [Hyphomicrobiales bacterium]